MKLHSLVLSLLLLSGWAGVIQAQTELEPMGALKRIAERKEIHLGYREAAVPFTYGNDKGGVQGFHWDLCLKVVDSIEKHLGVENLKVIPITTTSTNRSLMFATGLIDLDCSPVPNTRIAQKQVSFTVTTFVASLQVLVRKDSGLQSVAGLTGKRVGSISGSGSERFLKTSNVLQGGAVINVPSYSPAQALKLLESGRIDALVLDDVVVAVLLSQIEDRGQYQVIGDTLAFSPLAMVVARDDAEMKILVDSSLTTLMGNGEFKRIYDVWFTSPIPPRGDSLGLPMSDLLKRLLADPNDQGG